MKIYTSYFGNWRALKKQNVLLIGVSRYPPTYFDGITLLELAPTSNMLNMPDEQYDKLFAIILAKTNQRKIYNTIKKIANTANVNAVALCCFEKIQEECHRYNVAVWMNQKGYDIQEFKSELKKPPQKPIQLGLF